ncbi:hypothetical protein IJT17_07525 [bacterium]|nr:hypothetical protein [bacterium]
MVSGIRLYFTKHRMLWIATALLLGLAVWVITAEASLRRAARYAPQPQRPVTWELYRPHPTLFWELRPHFKGLAVHAQRACDDPGPNEMRLFQVTTNSWGMRNPETAQSKEDRQWRVLCLGDELTFGYGVNDADTYERKLFRYLLSLHVSKNIQVLNAGCPGWTSYQSREWARLVGRSFEPDVYVLGFGNADIMPEDYADSERVSSWAFLRSLDLLLSRSELYRYWQHCDALRYNTYGLPPADYKYSKLRVSKDEFRSNLQWFASIAKSDGAKLVILGLPYRSGAASYIADEYRFIMQETAQASGAVYIDLHSMMNADAKVLFDKDFHPNAKGYELIALTIMSEMQKRGWHKL